MTPEDAISFVRSKRPGAIETKGQEAAVRHFVESRAPTEVLPAPLNTPFEQTIEVSSLRDHELLFCVARFLCARDPQDFPVNCTQIISITATAATSSVLISYDGGGGEIALCERSKGHGDPSTGDVSVASTTIIRNSVSSQIPAATETHTPVPSTLSASTEVLLWAMRFLDADIRRDYSSQRKWLADDAEAFGAKGREAIVKANGEDLPEEETNRYTVQYPVSVDVGSQCVVLMFDAHSAQGQLRYRGTDIMEVSQGLVTRIVTINHASSTCYSAKQYF
jgi:hypothetical protein